MNYTAPADLLTDRVILVTGSAHGIGAAVAKACANHGAVVILLDKDIPALEHVYDDIVKKGAATPAIYPLDLKGANIPDYDTLATTIADNFGRLDGLIHCAASLGQIAPVEHQDPQMWLETMHINLTAPYLLTRACLPLMQKHDQTSIIFTSDGYKDKAYWSSYGISKAGIESLSKQLADELENNGLVRVNCIDPGKVATHLFTQAFPAIDPSSITTPENIVASYLYLMGNDSLATNGQIIPAQ